MTAMEFLMKSTNVCDETALEMIALWYLDHISLVSHDAAQP